MFWGPNRTGARESGFAPPALASFSVSDHFGRPNPSSTSTKSRGEQTTLRSDFVAARWSVLAMPRLEALHEAPWLELFPLGMRILSAPSSFFHISTYHVFFLPLHKRPKILANGKRVEITNGWPVGRVFFSPSEEGPGFSVLFGQGCRAGAKSLSLFTPFFFFFFFPNPPFLFPPFFSHLLGRGSGYSPDARNKKKTSSDLGGGGGGPSSPR